ncbi:MAG: RNA-binding S4 domain-containing protein [Salibacteraceae bacterium]
MRIDKFLWCVRLAKTRSIAFEMCSSGRVKYRGEEVKPSREVVPESEISIRENPIWRSYEILALPKSRVGAKLVNEFIHEITPAADLEQLELIRQMNRKNRLQGFAGRPTKRQRRNLDKFKDS